MYHEDFNTTNSNLAWQIGHLMMDQNFHALTVITAPNEEVNQLIPVSDTKYEALSWCFKHEMWHSAEMEAVKKELGHPIKWLRN